MRDESATADSVAAAKADLWWRENADRVRSFLVHQTDAATAEDLLVEVFILAMRRHAVVPEPPIGWLLRTARHVVANHRRWRRRYLGMLGRLAQAEVRSPAGGVDASTHGPAAQAELDALLDGASDNDREVLTLSAWYGLSPAEAAEALGISVNAFTVRLHRARRRLQGPGPQPERTEEP